MAPISRKGNNFQMEAQPKISIVIPHYNNHSLLWSNLPFVLECSKTYPGESEIIVVDDASEEDGLQEIQKEFSSINFITHKKNKGFGEAVNSGVSEASGTLLFLLNSDVSPDPTVMTSLSKFFTSRDLFSVSPLIVDEDQKANHYSWNLRSVSKGQLKRKSWSLIKAKKLSKHGNLPTLYTSGGSMMTRKSMFQSLGGFDPIFHPYYFEDQDLGARAWKKGWRSVFDPMSLVEHQSEGTIKKTIPPRRVRAIRKRNGLILDWLHLPKGQLWFRSPFYIWKLFRRVLKGDLSFAAGFLLALLKIPSILTRRSKSYGVSNYIEVLDQIDEELSTLEKICDEQI